MLNTLTMELGQGSLPKAHESLRQVAVVLMVVTFKILTKAMFC